MSRRTQHGRRRPADGLRFVIGLLLGMGATAGSALWRHPGVGPGPALPHPWPQRDEVISAEDYAGLAELAGRVTRDELESALAVVNPYGTLDPFVDFADAAAVLYDSAERQTELARVPWREATTPLPSAPAHTVAGLRILIDPGHFGGEFAEGERRHFVIRNREPVREGDLNWGVAQVLMRRFAAAGAEVVLARGPPPDHPFPELDPASPVLDSDAAMLAWLEAHLGGFQTVIWLRDHPERLTRFRVAAAGALRAPGLAKERGLHHVFARFDYRRRGLMAAEVEADLLLSLHHNISGRDWINRLVVFTPGFIRNDTDNPPGRYFAFRRLLEGDTPLMIDLAYDISRAMQRELEVPTHQFVRKADFNKLPLFPHHGVFARNLGVLRRASGPAILVEGPCMNHVEENLLLLEKDFKLAGRWYPERVKQYARAVFKAVSANAERLWQQRERRRP